MHKIILFLICSFAISACSVQMEIGRAMGVEKLTGVVNVQGKKIDEIYNYLKEQEAAKQVQKSTVK